jgi:hypothetical protein
MRGTPSEQASVPEIEMRMIHVQVQPERVKRLNIAAVDMSLRRLGARRELGRRFRFEEGNDRGRYMTFNFTTAKPAALWEAMRAGPFRSALLRSAAMVLCEGENGWDDYLLLHHWDRRRKLDPPPITARKEIRRRRFKRACD